LLFSDATVIIQNVIFAKINFRLLKRCAFARRRRRKKVQGDPATLLTVEQGSVVNRAVRTELFGFQRARTQTYVVQSASEKGAAGDGVVSEGDLSAAALAWSILLRKFSAITVQA